jgi:hypothetical protein
MSIITLIYYYIFTLLLNFYAKCGIKEERSVAEHMHNNSRGGGTTMRSMRSILLISVLVVLALTFWTTGCKDTGVDTRDALQTSLSSRPQPGVQVQVVDPKKQAEDRFKVEMDQAKQELSKKLEGDTVLKSYAGLIEKWVQHWKNNTPQVLAKEDLISLGSGYDVISCSPYLQEPPKDFDDRRLMCTSDEEMIAIIDPYVRQKGFEMINVQTITALFASGIYTDFIAEPVTPAYGTQRSFDNKITLVFERDGNKLRVSVAYFWNDMEINRLKACVRADALKVQRAVDEYIRDCSVPPDDLDQLVSSKKLICIGFDGKKIYENIKIPPGWKGPYLQYVPAEIKAPDVCGKRVYMGIEGKVKLQYDLVSGTELRSP